MWKIKGLSGDGTWSDFGTCEVKISEKSITLYNIRSERIVPKVKGGKVIGKREWSPEIEDKDFASGEFVWYYLKTGMPYIFTKTLGDKNENKSD